VGRGAAHTKKPERVPLSGFGFMFLDSVWEGVSTIPRYTTGWLDWDLGLGLGRGRGLGLGLAGTQLAGDWADGLGKVGYVACRGGTRKKRDSNRPGAGGQWVAGHQCSRCTW
jgi:hypothetical protein